MIIDLIAVLNKEEDPDPDPKEIRLDPDLRGPKCNGSFGSGSGTLHTSLGFVRRSGTSRTRYRISCYPVPTVLVLDAFLYLLKHFLRVKNHYISATKK